MMATRTKRERDQAKIDKKATKQEKATAATEKRKATRSDYRFTAAARQIATERGWAEGGSCAAAG
jgi:hypothetical protein